MASQAGIDLISTINQELLKSAKLTGIWENKLRRIERGDYKASEFIDELKAQINEIVINVLSDNSSKRILVTADDTAPVKEKKKNGSEPAKKKRTVIKSFEQIACPVCGTGHIVKGHSAYGCSNYSSGCHTVFPFTEYPADLTPAKLASALKKNKK